MFLQPQQASLPTPSMAQIASDPPLNPDGFPFCDYTTQVDQDSFANFLPFHDPGLCSVYGQGVGENTQEIPKSRKRGREDELGLNAWINTKMNGGVRLIAEGFSDNLLGCCSVCSSLDVDNDIAVKMQRELEEMDLFVLMQIKKLRLELEERRKNYWFNILRVVEEEMQRIMKGKDEDIANLSRKTTALEDKVRILLMEGQTWKTLAQTNEATIMSLRRDLELAKAKEGEGENGEIDDSMSCCNDPQLNTKRNCHGCQKNEISVLILPCRHLCICSDCEHKFTSCPICISPKSASIKVYMS